LTHRRGKFLTVHFESGDRMAIHLRMTGQLLVTPDDYPVGKHKKNMLPNRELQNRQKIRDKY